MCKNWHAKMNKSECRSAWFASIGAEEISEIYNYICSDTVCVQRWNGDITIVNFKNKFDRVCYQPADCRPTLSSTQILDIGQGMISIYRYFPFPVYFRIFLINWNFSFHDRKSCIKYHDLDDEDFLWSFLGIFEPHSAKTLVDKFLVWKSLVRQWYF